MYSHFSRFSRSSGNPDLYIKLNERHQSYHILIEMTTLKSEYSFLSNVNPGESMKCVSIQMSPSSSE